MAGYNRRNTPETPVYRALRGPSGASYPVKLEQRWWTLFDRIGAEEGVSASKYVATLLDRAGPVDNRASFLRRAAADWLEARAVDVSPDMRRREGIALVTASVAPAALIGADAGLIALNRAFLRDIERRRTAAGALVFDDISIAGRAALEHAIATTIAAAPDVAQFEVAMNVADLSARAAFSAVVFDRGPDRETLLIGFLHPQA